MKNKFQMGLGRVFCYSVGLFLLLGCAIPQNPLSVEGHWINPDKNYLQFIAQNGNEGEVKIFSMFGEPAYANTIRYTVRENVKGGANYHLQLTGVPAAEPLNRKVVVVDRYGNLTYGSRFYARIDSNQAQEDVRKAFETFKKGIFHAHQPTEDLVGVLRKYGGLDVLHRKDTALALEPWDWSLLPSLPWIPGPILSSLTGKATYEGKSVKCAVYEYWISEEITRNRILYKKGSISEIRKIEEAPGGKTVLRTQKGYWECERKEAGVAKRLEVRDLLEFADLELYNFEFFIPGHADLIRKRIYKKEN